MRIDINLHEICKEDTCAFADMISQQLILILVLFFVFCDDYFVNQDDDLFLKSSSLREI